MKETLIKISVLMPAYNTGEFIAEAIKSVLNQTFTEFELIIIDDGSTDNTAAIVQSFHDPRIVFIQQENKGIASALNTGLQYARAEYIARFDSDDICYPYRLQKQYEFLSSHPEYVIVGSAVDYIEQQGRYIFTYYPSARSFESLKATMHHTCPFIHSSVLYHKNTILKHGGYNSFALSFEDHLLWINVLKESKGYNLQEPMVKVRLNPNSVTIDEKWRTHDFRRIKYKALRKNEITEAEAKKLQQALLQQNKRQIKEGAYYALLAKKYLWNNPQPQRARLNLRKALLLNKWNWNGYIFYILSFLPSSLLQKTYRRIKQHLHS
jgi:glycosyltransferase involved in cell wall biosynthesis